MAYAGNGTNFVLYNHHMATPGEKEIMLMNDIGQLPDGTRYTAQMIELELGITDQWTTEFMIEGQNTSGQGGYNFTGFRWENRYRLFDENVFLNPVLYLEYEDLSADSLYLMEVSGREDAADTVKPRPREQVLETRLILFQDLTDTLNWRRDWPDQCQPEYIPPCIVSQFLNYRNLLCRRANEQPRGNPTGDYPLG